MQPDPDRLFPLTELQRRAFERVASAGPRALTLRQLGCSADTMRALANAGLVRLDHASSRVSDWAFRLAIGPSTVAAVRIWIVLHQDGRNLLRGLVVLDHPRLGHHYAILGRHSRGLELFPAKGFPRVNSHPFYRADQASWEKVYRADLGWSIGEALPDDRAAIAAAGYDLPDSTGTITPTCDPLPVPEPWPEPAAAGKAASTVPAGPRTAQLTLFGDEG